MSMGRRPRDLSGQKFGLLTAVYPTERRDHRGSVYWHCVCECGNEIDVAGTCVEVLEKRKKRRDNESGFRGVFYLKNSNRYRVDIGFKGKRYYVGLFEDYDEAVQARLEAENLIHNSFINIWKEWNQKDQEDPQWGKEHPLVFNVRKVNGELQVEAGCQEIKTS